MCLKNVTALLLPDIFRKPLSLRLLSFQLQQLQHFVSSLSFQLKSWLTQKSL